MKRYKFLNKEEVFDSLDKLRDAFLASKNGDEVEEIINGLLTFDERIKIGRRIIIAQYIASGTSLEEINKILKVGKNTIAHVARLIDEYPMCYELIRKRSEFVEKQYRSKKYNKAGGPELIFKRKEYSGFRRKDVKRERE